MTNVRQSEPKVIGREGNMPKTRDEQEQAQAAEEYASSKNAEKATMEVKVESPFTSYFKGKAFSLSGVNATGPFDILPKHHNFISLLEPCTLTIRIATGEEQKIDISGGLLHVKADKVTVFLDI